MSSPGGEIVLVSGPPGSGKTTIAGLLAAEGERTVHLESDWFYRWIQSGFVGPHLPEAREQNEVVTDLMTDTAAGYAAAGYVVFWDGLIGPWWLDRISGRLAARGVRLRYLVLRPERGIALDRVRQRDGTTEVSGAETMFDQLADLGELESHVVASDGEIAEVLARAREMLVDDRLRLDRSEWIDDRWSVSVKGVIGWGDRFVVLRNDRDEWELPGGRLEAGDDSPADALRREMVEELGLDVEVGGLVDSWILTIGQKRVLILTFACSAPQPVELTYSDEHRAAELLTVDELAAESIPAGYVRSIRRSVLPDVSTARGDGG